MCSPPLFITTVHYIYWFSCVEPLLGYSQPAHVYFNGWLDSGCCVLLSSYQIILVRDIGHLFLMLSLSGFGIRVMLAPRRIWEVSLFVYILEEF